MGPQAAPGLESEYKPSLPTGRLPGAELQPLNQTVGGSNPSAGTSRIPTLNTILDREWLSFVYGRPRLSAPKDVKKDVKSGRRAA
jgi:hypothetical protein